MDHRRSSQMLTDESARNTEPPLDQENLLFMIQSTVSVESLEKINRILRQVELLNDVERLILYLKLPGSEDVPVDPLRCPLNPLGSRSELQQTLAWIRTHLEPDREVSMPKQDVYEEYTAYCSANGVKPLSTADFGKIMKQAFPDVKPRRLGVRGQSRYCYAGLRKKLKLDSPKLPDPEAHPDNPSREPVARWATDELEAADQMSLCTVLGWAGGMFGRKFQTVAALAEHISVMPENGKFDHMESEPDSVSPNPKIAPAVRGGKRKCSTVPTETRRGRGGKRGRPPNVKLEGRIPSVHESRESEGQCYAGGSQGYVDPALLHMKRDVCDNDDHDQNALCSDPLLSEATAPHHQRENMQTSQESVSSNNTTSPMCAVPSQGDNHAGSADSDVMNHCSAVKPGDNQSHANQLSQLRILLENNLTTAEEEVHSNSKHVSFEDEVPASPNTRRRAFNFTPISPRQTPVASPFVSPRQTPVHMRPQCGDTPGEQFLSPVGRSRHSSASSLLLQQRARPLSGAQSYPRSAPMSPLVHNECRSRGLPPGDPRRRHMSAGIVGVNPRFITDMPCGDVGMDSQSHLPALLRSQSVPLQQMMCGDPSSTPSTPIGSAPFQFPPASPWLENAGMTPTPVPSECYDFGPDAIDADSLHSIISEVYASGQLDFAESVLDSASGGNITTQTMNPLNSSLQTSDDARQRSDTTQCNSDPQTSKFYFL